MSYLTSKYYLWYVQGGDRFLLTEVDPSSTLQSQLRLTSCVAVCALLLAGTLFKVWAARRSFVKPVCIVVGTLAFAGAVHWVQRAIFLYESTRMGGQPTVEARMCVITHWIPVTTPFVIIMVGQLILFFLMGFSRPESGSPAASEAN